MIKKKCPNCEEWFTNNKANGYDYRGDLITHLIAVHGYTQSSAQAFATW